jgi:uridine kinase
VDDALMNRRKIIGIAGGTASGKSTLADVLFIESGALNSVILK